MVGDRISRLGSIEGKEDDLIGSGRRSSKFRFHLGHGHAHVTDFPTPDFPTPFGDCRVLIG